MKYYIILVFFTISNQLFSIENSLDTLTNPKNECDVRPAFLQKQAPNIKYPSTLFEMGIQGEVYISYLVNENGILSNVKINGGMEKSAQEESLKAFKMIKQMKPAQFKGKNIPYLCLDTLRFCYDCDNKKINYIQNFEKKYENWKEFQKNGNSKNSDYNFEAESYLLSELKLKYLNWKKETKNFEKNKTKTKTIKIEKIDFEIEVGKNDICNLYLFYPSTSTFDKPEIKGKSYIQKLATKNQQVLIVAFKYTKEKAFLAIKETTIDEKSGLDLVFEPVSMELLKASFSKLH